jgi:hyperosmotically inducible periplasmic protein
VTRPPYRLATFAVLTLGCAAPTLAQQTESSSGKQLTQIVVTAQAIKDDAVTQQVETALRLDPVVDDRHVTVTTRNGVVTLHGFVQEAWDLMALRRVAKRQPGVRRIVNEVELVLNDQ